MDEQTAVLEFWFGVSIDREPSYTQQRKLWFHKSEQTDQTIRHKFRSVYDRVVAGDYSFWRETAQGCLALVIVLDQFSRNMFRDTPQAFATDPQALEIAQWAIAQGFDQRVFPAQRIFFYLPLEHSEDIQHQQESLRLSQALANTRSEFRDIYNYALKHYEVIERFGRFPHRNEILGRCNTVEEAEFLKQPGSSF